MLSSAHSLCPSLASSSSHLRFTMVLLGTELGVTTVPFYGRGNNDMENLPRVSFLSFSCFFPVHLYMYSHLCACFPLTLIRVLSGRDFVASFTSLSPVPGTQRHLYGRYCWSEASPELAGSRHNVSLSSWLRLPCSPGPRLSGQASGDPAYVEGLRGPNWSSGLGRAPLWTTGPLLMAVGPSSDAHPFPCLGLFLTLP